MLSKMHHGRDDLLAAWAPSRRIVGGSNFWQIITTSAEVTLNGGLIRELPQNPLNSGLGIMLICPEILVPEKFGGHDATSTLISGHLNSQSQKGHKEFPGIYLLLMCPGPKVQR